MDQLYVGWTMPGEWINYTIKADQTAAYKVSLMYTANGDGIIAFDLDGREVAKNLKVTSTHNDQDTVKWRQWHHWNKADSLTTVRINQGIHMLTLHIVANGNMNSTTWNLKIKAPGINPEAQIFVTQYTMSA